MNKKLRLVLIGLFLSVSFSAYFFSGCAGKKAIGELPKISSGELLDSLIAQDTLLKTFHIRGKGKFLAGDKENNFAMSLIARRANKLHLRVVGPLGISVAVLWLCGQDSLCIFIPSKATVLVEPLGEEIPDVILPPSAPVMLDMFCGMAPIYRFSDSLQNFERTSDGYYLTFKKNGEVLIALAKPNPWHVEEFQWVRTANTNEQVDVKFSKGKIRDGIWRPQKIEITAPALGQKLTATIKKDRLNIEIPDSMFTPEIPPKARWQSAF